jgi:MFS family permease
LIAESAESGGFTSADAEALRPLATMDEEIFETMLISAEDLFEEVLRVGGNADIGAQLGMPAGSGCPPAREASWPPSHSNVSAGASSAHLTVSEIFPLETRGLAIALFFAVGTAIGGITGSALFGKFIHSGQVSKVALGFFIGAGAMILGGLAEVRWGVAAEGQSLEDIATPLTAEEAEEERTPEHTAELQAERERWDRIAARAAQRTERERHGLRRSVPAHWRFLFARACSAPQGR